MTDLSNRPGDPSPADACPASTAAAVESSEQARPAARHAGGFTLDLSTGRASSARAARKGTPALVQQTINLSTRRSGASGGSANSSENAAASPPSPSEPRSARSQDDARGGQQPGRQQPGRQQPSGSARKRSRGHSGGGAGTLADLLDAETLARLRGR